MKSRYPQGLRFSLLLLFGLTLLMGHRLAQAQTAPKFTVLHNFTGAGELGDGALSYTTLSLGLDGNYYGTTYGGGAYGEGSVFKITPSGTLTTLHSFNFGDGYGPFGKLALGFDGNFYGMTSEGGANGVGTVFKITCSGTLTTLHSFDPSTDGAYPADSLTLGIDGNFYGMTAEGGTYDGGTVFKVTPSGTLTTLHSFNYTDGDRPFGKLALGFDGNFYGMTYEGGTNGVGTVFKITCSGAFTVLHSFDYTDGASSYSGLTLGFDGNFYGLTYEGGTYGTGTVFKITCSGTLTTLHSFDYATEGGYPTYESLVLGFDGNFYGTTGDGGVDGYGTVFKITCSGTLTVLHSFNYSTDGGYLYGGLNLGFDGKLYGVTYEGGANGYGTVFNLQVKWF